ncbi:MAG: FFLEELY motif protein [Steroidobacterales bacterium]
MLDAQLAAAPELAPRLQELRTWQAARLAHTYADLRQDPQLSRGLEFFLTDLYGPHDFTHRNRQLARAWRYFKRALPSSAIEVLAKAIELEVLTAELDQAMVSQLTSEPLIGASYAAAYRAVGRPEQRRRQIDLIISLGEQLERIVRHPGIGLALRAARAPAHAAGLGMLQDFLERGFSGFRHMQDAQRLLGAIRERELQLMQALFNGSHDPFDTLAANVHSAHG